MTPAGGLRVLENSDPNHRPINVVTFLAAHPTETFTLAELTRHLGLSKGSAHRVMTALAESGFVHRHPRHKTYSLGIALVAIGQAALQKYPGIEFARREMARLVSELHVGCGATAIVNNEYLLLGREGAPHAYDGLTLVGERRFVVPPIGIGQMAWRGEAEVEEYLRRGAAYLTGPVCRRLRASFPIIRRRGYSMAANGLGLRRLVQATIVPIGQTTHTVPKLSTLAHDVDIPLDEYQMLAFNEARGKGVNYLAAPVFSPDGDICFELLVSGLPVEMTDGEFARYTTRLLLAADIVTKEIRGRKPSHR
jgi:DNA-binding IclR family transcriptional regulator